MSQELSDSYSPNVAAPEFIFREFRGFIMLKKVIKNVLEMVIKTVSLTVKCVVFTIAGLCGLNPDTSPA